MFGWGGCTANYRIMATAACRWRRDLLSLLLAVWALSQNLATQAENISGSKPVTFKLELAETRYHDIELELSGIDALLVSEVKVKLNGRLRETSRVLLPPKRHEGPPQLSWLLCDSAFAETLEARIKWKDDLIEENDKEVKVRYWRKDARVSAGQEWQVTSAGWQYRRLLWPESGTQQGAAAVVHSTEPLPAVACLKNGCHTHFDVNEFSATAEDCRPFTDFTSFRLHDLEDLPTYLYVNLTNSVSQVGKSVNQVGKSVKAETKIDSWNKIAAWIEELQSKSPTVGGSFKTTQDALKPGKTRPAHTASGASRSATSSSGGRPPTETEPQRSGAPDVATPPRAGSSHASSSASANNRNGDVSITYNFNPSLSASMEHVNSNQRSGSDPQVKTKAETKTETETETETAADGEAGLGEQISGEVTGQQPRAIQIHGGSATTQDGPLLFQIESDGPLDALLLTSEPKHLRISFFKKHGSLSVGRARLQLCPSELAGRRLNVTLSTPAEGSVSFTARLSQPNKQLSLESSSEVELARSSVPEEVQSLGKFSVRQLTFPGYESPVGLTVDAPPQLCLRASLFTKMCSALAGQLKEAFVHKYLSSGDYLPLAHPDRHSRRAFLRTEWAPGERCGLGTGAALPVSRGLPRVLLSLSRHEDSEVWPAVLLPPLSLALLLPAVVYWLVRAAAARWRHGSPTDDDNGVKISELPETPHPPRHVPQLTGPEGDKPDPAPSPAPASPARAAATLLSEVTYPDLAAETKRLIGAALAGGSEAVRTDSVYPDLSGEQRREGAEERGREEGERKERLAAELGVGGSAAPPSAPAAPDRHDQSVSLSRNSDHGDTIDTALCRSTSDASEALLVTAGPGPRGLLTPVRGVPAPELCGFVVTVMATTTYFSAAALQSFFSGDAGACPVSASYTVLSAALPGVGGLANLLPTASFGLCLWWLRRVWYRHAHSSLLRRGVVWPAPGLEWLLLAYGAQAAVSGLCPGQNPFFATNTFTAAFVGVLTVSRLPWARPGPALACCVAGSALASAGQWLPSQPPGLPLVLRFCLIPTAHLGSVILLLRPLMAATDGLTKLQRVRLLLTGQLLAVSVSQLGTAVLGALLLSPAGYLGLAGLTTLLNTQWLTRRRKGTVSVRTPFSPYGRLSQLAGCLSFATAIVLGELAYGGKLGLLEASSTGQLAYLVACLSLALGISPRPRRLQ